MSDDLRLELEGLEETQRVLREAAEAVSADGGLEGVIAKGMLRAWRYAVAIVHVLTGRLKNSLHGRVHRRGNDVYGLIYSNVIYARREHELGGEHAYFQRTIDEEGPAIVEMMQNDLYREVG